MTTRLAALLTLSISTVALAAVPTLTGTFQVLNNGPGDQSDPHVDCNIAPYTNDDFQGTTTIRYYDFASSTDHEVPGNGADSLSDVSSGRIAYTEATAFGTQVLIYDTVSGNRTAVPGFNRKAPALGGNLVAFEDRSYFGDPNESEIGVYDLSTGTVTRLTNDTLFDKNPSVSPNGNAVVWEKCDTHGLNCDVYSAIQTGPGTFQIQVLTGAGEDRGPDTNGALAVYVSDKSGENDIYYQPVGGGAETHISLPGDQRDVSISGNLIAFESKADGVQYDIYVYDLANDVLYQVTNTPVDETLNDISVCNGVGRIVYASPAADYDVYAFTFVPPVVTPPPPPDCQPAADACADPTGRTLLADLTVTRTTGAPNSASATFADADGAALVCITNHRATSGEVSIDARRVVGPAAFKHQVDLIALRVDDVQAVNALEASIAGQSGTSFEVKVYSDSGQCTCGTRSASALFPDGELLRGERLTSAGRFIQMKYDLDAPLEADAAMGCSATSGLALSGLMVLALWLAARRRPAAARTRRP